MSKIKNCQKHKNNNLGDVESTTCNKQEFVNDETSKLKFENVTKYLGLFTTLISAIALIGTLAFKYISLGRCMYFYFDMDYYDFSISNSNIFIFVFLIFSSTISTILTSFFEYIRVKIVNSIINKPKATKWFVFILELLIFILINICIGHMFGIKEYIILYLLITIILSTILYFSVIRGYFETKQGLKVALIVVILLFIIISCAFMKTQFNHASEQRIFPIIIEQIEKDNVEDEIKYYIVISQGEQYSAYLCDIVDESVCIYTNKHKYFDINSETYSMEFTSIRTSEELISADKLLEISTELKG